MASWQKPSLTAYIWQLGKVLGKSSPCLHVAYSLHPEMYVILRFEICPQMYVILG